jgi:putative endonuclease
VLLVWFEVAGSMEGAILREKQIKAGSRVRKLALIEAGNPEWRDLYPGLV